MREIWGAEKLEAELEAAKDGLRGLEKNIRKILGRDVPDGENGAVAPVQNRGAQKRPMQDDVRGRRLGTDFPNNGFGPKRRWQQGSNNVNTNNNNNNNNNPEPKTVFSRLSARAPAADDSDNEDDNSFKPAVSSRVIATPREIPSRQDVIRRESTDERSKQRNRRMFGALLGTLQKFRQEETKLKAKEDKKAEVEARVEEAKRREKEELKRERQQLFLSRKQQLAQVKALEIKLARSKQYQDWRSSQIPLLNFIKTKTQPSIYYLPKRSTPQTDTLLQESSNELKAEIDRRERELVDELEMIQSQAGSHRNSHNKSNENFDHSMEEPEEENRDPNPEKNGDVRMTDTDSQTKKISSKFKEQDKHDDKVEDKEVDRYEHTEDREEDDDEDKEESKEEDTTESIDLSKVVIKKEKEEDSMGKKREEKKDDSKEEEKEDACDDSKEKEEDDKDSSKGESKDDSPVDNEETTQLERDESSISILQEEQDEKMDESTD
ncbi:pinin [Copidosoma floridanum]|uniref:pinin n=1 Tax=Copidosoma floridanum TaxID=29053 RepID=UPI0006C98412|nr:pinin [Copidosoma floridanum]